MNFYVVKVFIFDKLEFEFSNQFYYYGIYYMFDVLYIVEEFCYYEKVIFYEEMLLKIVVLFYDFGFIIFVQEYECFGCGIVCDYLFCYGYKLQEIECICGMIMAIKILQIFKNRLE